MSIVYRKVKKVLNFRENKPEVYKLHQLTFPQVSFAELVDECSESCGVNRAQTKAVADALLNRIIDTAAYTLKLNLQNGYIWDGIKRDRLVWSGDLHQEILLSMYLYGDNANRH